MKKLKFIRSYILAGFFFLLPVFVIFILIAKAWGYLSTIGARISALFGMKSILGIGSDPIFTGLVLLLIFFVCGILVIRFGFMKRMQDRIENQFVKHIPGYETYKAMAEEKLYNKEKSIPYVPALLKSENDFLKPVYVIEDDDKENSVVYIPDIPETGTGQIFIVKTKSLTILTSTTANELDKILKSKGKGLLDNLSL